ncbi:MAG: glycosyltransferase family 4 protein [Candidatus Tectomicrobia bacterium]|nr:glycosyltransferase family 4 protein [Candidatus Tectomicrobia bacterium]
MNIALLIESFSPSQGGGEAYVTTLARRLVEMGHHVEVFCHRAENVPAAIRVHHVPAARWPRWRYACSFVRNLQKALREARSAGRRFDVIHGSGKCLGMNLYRAGGGVHAVWIEQDLASRSQGWQRTLKYVERRLDPWTHAMAWIERRQYLDPRVHIVANSQRVREDIRRWYGVEEQRLSVVPNGVDIERFHPGRRHDRGRRLRATWGVDSEGKILLFVANNWRLKGLLPLLDACRLLQEEAPRERLRLLVVGRGRRRHWERLARQRGIRELVTFAGPSATIEDAYAAADLLVHPTFYDPCANVCLEALASGLPVVTTACNGAAELLRDGTAGRVIATPHDHRALASAILSLLDDDTRERAALAARRLAERYPLSRHVEEMLRLYERLQQRGAPSPP